MVYDCFSFFNELDLLEIRLNVLDRHVDKFVLVEADRTHSNKPKPYYFEENKERFKKFLDRIIHIKIKEYPEFKTAWTNENHQRNMILEGLKNCHEDDVILISDLDEIPNPDAIQTYNKDGIYILDQMSFSFFLNYKSVIKKHWYGTNILQYKDILNNETEKHPYEYSKTYLEELNKGCTPTKIRMIKSFPKIKKGGWHFTYLGGIDRIKQKLESFAHDEFNKKEYKSDERIHEILEKGIDLFNPGDNRFIPVSIDKSFPVYIKTHQERFSRYIYPLQKHYKVKNAILITSSYIYYYSVRFPRKILRKIKKKFI